MKNILRDQRQRVGLKLQQKSFSPATEIALDEVTLKLVHPDAVISCGKISEIRDGLTYIWKLSKQFMQARREFRMHAFFHYTVDLLYKKFSIIVVQKAFFFFPTDDFL